MVDCKMCGKCCSYVTIDIGKPKSKEDYNLILWYLLHKNVKVFEQDGTWFVQFDTPCTQFTKSKGCTFYKKRPKICRDHKAGDCEGYDNDPYDFLFTTADQFLEYMKKRGIDYKYKSFKN